MKPQYRVDFEPLDEGGDPVIVIVAIALGGFLLLLLVAALVLAWRMIRG